MLKRPMSEDAASGVVADYIRRKILAGELRRGDKLPPERDLVQQLRLSRTSVRAGLQQLASTGVVTISHGRGTFVADGPLVLDSEQFHFLSTLHGFSRAEMFEARRSLEGTVAELAARRATGEDIAAIADAVTGMFASANDPLEFLRYDAAFHQALAAASKNPVLASLVGMVSGTFFEGRRRAPGRMPPVAELAEPHRKIYLAVRSRDAEAARRRMIDHLIEAEQILQAELGDAPLIRPDEAPQRRSDVPA
jgi:GntR family transcriptional repressor for pyruvate dehydrogenase complex